MLLVFAKCRSGCWIASLATIQDHNPSRNVIVRSVLAASGKDLMIRICRSSRYARHCSLRWAHNYTPPKAWPSAIPHVSRHQHFAPGVSSFSSSISESPSKNNTSLLRKMRLYCFRLSLLLLRTPCSCRRFHNLWYHV
jgi:hypothetical protein